MQKSPCCFEVEREAGTIAFNSTNDSAFSCFLYIYFCAKVQQGPSGPPLPPPAAAPPTSYLISANAPAATYYHSPLPSTTTTNESPVVSMATMAVMTSLVPQPTTCNTDQSEVGDERNFPFGYKWFHLACQFVETDSSFVLNYWRL